MGYAAFWRWKSRPYGGRSRIGSEVCDLIRRVSIENPLWGTPRIHGELLKLVYGFDLHGAEAGPAIAELEDVPSQSWEGDCMN
jgi:hypothetical protein